MTDETLVTTDLEQLIPHTVEVEVNLGSIEQLFLEMANDCKGRAEQLPRDAVRVTPSAHEVRLDKIMGIDTDNFIPNTLQAERAQAFYAIAQGIRAGSNEHLEMAEQYCAQTAINAKEKAEAGLVKLRSLEPDNPDVVAYREMQREADGLRNEAGSQEFRQNSPVHYELGRRRVAHLTKEMKYSVVGRLLSGIAEARQAEANFTKCVPVLAEAERSSKPYRHNRLKIELQKR